MGEGQTLWSERSELQRAQGAKASEASQSLRMRAVVYLKLGTGQTKTPHITQTINYTEHNLQAVHKTDKVLDLVTADRGASGGGRGRGGSRAKAKEHNKSLPNATICMNICGASNICKNIYRASNICMNSCGASNICMNIYGAYNI